MAPCGPPRRGTVLVVEDDPSIAQIVELYLRRDGFDVVVAGDAERGLDVAARGGVALAVVDIGLPGAMDGLELCRKLQAEHPVPVVVLTARDTEVDRILGLELGADDYITKPFSPRELVARVRAVLRRGDRAATATAAAGADAVRRIADIEVDAARREVRAAGTVVPLTAREYELLAFLAANQGLALSRTQILDGAWGPGWYGDERTVDVHVRQLRAKLGDGLPLDTVRGLGYRLG